MEWIPRASCLLSTSHCVLPAGDNSSAFNRARTVVFLAHTPRLLVEKHQIIKKAIWSSWIFFKQSKARFINFVMSDISFYTTIWFYKTNQAVGQKTKNIFYINKDKGSVHKVFSKSLHRQKM